MDKQKIDILIKNGVVVSGSGMKKQDVLICDGRIRNIVSDSGTVIADREIDAGGRYVMPGIIDAHFHPVYADRIDTLSKAAATGGITTLIPYVGAVKAWGQGG